MTSQKVALLGILLVVITAGCLGALSDSEEEDLEVEIDWDSQAIDGFDYDVDVTLTNNGSDVQNDTVTLSVEGDEVDTMDLSVDPDETEDATLSHSFDEPGEYDLTAADEEWTVSVIEDPSSDIMAEMDQVSSIETEEELSAEIVMDEETITMDASGNGVYDYEDERHYLKLDGAVSMMGFNVDMTMEEWYKNGTLYERETTESDPPEYSSEETTFEDAGILPEEMDEMILIIQPEITEDEYIYTVDLTDFENMTGMPGFDDFEDDEAMEDIDELSATITVDRKSNRVKSFSIVGKFNIEEDMNEMEFDMKYDAQYVDYNVDPDITVPDEVVDGAEDAQDGFGL